MNTQRLRGFVASLWLAGFVLLMMACGVDTGVAAIEVGNDVASKAGETSIKPPTSELIGLQRQTKLLPGEIGTAGLYGYSVALSEDGSLAVVGAPHDDEQGSDAGAVFILENTGNTWVQRTVLQPQKGAIGELFGSSLAISGDFMAVGAPGANGNEGAVYVFERHDNAWSLSKILTATGGAVDDGFGVAVALSGTTVVVGAAGDDAGGTDAGAAYVFVYKGLQWSQQAKLEASDAAPGDAFGTAVAIQQDTVVIGAPHHDVGSAIDEGVAYVFERAGSSWSQTHQLIGAEGKSGDAFGAAVSVSESRVLIGAPQADVVAYESGAAYVFAYDGTQWQENKTLLPSDGSAFGAFGRCVALSGTTAVVGALSAESGTMRGVGYVYSGNFGAWIQQDALKSTNAWSANDFGVAVAVSGNTALIGVSNAAMNDIGLVNAFVRSSDDWSNPKALEARHGAAHDEFGVSVSISGNTALVGAIYDDVNGHNDQGSAYVFVYDGKAWTLQAKLVADDGGPNEYFGISVAISGDRAVIGTAEGGLSSTGVVYVFARQGTTWIQEAKLSPSDGKVNDYFGYSIAISGNTLLVGAPQADAGLFDAGAVYVFVYEGATWVERAKLEPNTPGVYGFFGGTVALIDKTALVSQWDDGSGTDRGQVEVFGEKDGIWLPEATLLANDASAGDIFGFSVALSGDTALVGAAFRDGLETNEGAAYVFVRNGSTWTEQTMLVDDPPKPSGAFGSAIALGGSTALIGSYWDDPGGNAYQGAAHLFVRSEDTWIERTKFVDPDGVAGQLFGLSVALSEDASLGLVGANGDDVVGIDSGSVSVYEISLSLGLGCNGAAACQSGLCVDGVCCNSPCDGPCLSCVASTNAFGASGICGPAIDGTMEPTCTTDPENPCGNTGYCKTGTCELVSFSDTAYDKPICLGNFRYDQQICNGLGSLIPDPNSLESCGAYQCDKATLVCKSECSTKDDCAAGFKCSDTECIASGECKNVSDCASNEVCDGQTRRCVATEVATTPDEYDNACTCQMPGIRSRVSAIPVMVMVLALLRRRKKLGVVA